MSSRQNSTIYCQVRKDYVKETPEERVRQNTLSSLFSLGFCPSLVLVERKIADLPHLQAHHSKMPNRRVDILCYEGRTLQPYLLVECKSKSFSSKELRQLLGYNYYVGASFIALASPDKVELFDKGGKFLSNYFFYYNNNFM